MADRIRARCRVCLLDFYLSEVTRSPEGRCPRCGRKLAPAYTKMMVGEAARICRAHAELLEAVRILVSLPGNLELIPHTLVRDLLEEVDWQEQIAEDRQLIRREIDELERLAHSFARVVGKDGEDKAELRTGLQRLARLLTGHAERLEAGRRRADEVSGEAVVPSDEAGAGVVRAAAAGIDKVSGDTAPATTPETLGALEAARASIGPRHDQTPLDQQLRS